MRYVITGAGQIGIQLAQDLIRDGHEVVIVRRGEHAPAGATLLRGDAGDRDLLMRAVTGASAVFHCIHSSYSAPAWERDLPHREQAVMDVAARAGIPVVFPESVYAYGHGARDLFEGAAPAPVSPLGRVRTQLLADRAAHPARTLSVVAADLLGPTAAPGTSVFLSLVLEPAARGRRAWVMGDPDAERSATYIPDLTRAMSAAASRSEDLAPTGDAVLLAPSLTPLTQREMAAEAARAMEPGNPRGTEAGAEVGKGMATGGSARESAHATAPPATVVSGSTRRVPAARVSRIPAAAFSVAGLISPMARELSNQRYLWADRAVIHPGRLTTEWGLEPTSWAHVIEEWARNR